MSLCVPFLDFWVFDFFFNNIVCAPLNGENEGLHESKQVPATNTKSDKHVKITSSKLKKITRRLILWWSVTYGRQKIVCLHTLRVCTHALEQSRSCLYTNTIPCSCKAVKLLVQTIPPLLVPSIGIIYKKYQEDRVKIYADFAISEVSNGADGRHIYDWNDLFGRRANYHLYLSPIVTPHHNTRHKSHVWFDAISKHIYC